MRTKGIEKRLFIGFIGVCFLLILLPYLGQAAIPQRINYQGYLTDAKGVPINQTLQITFRIYSASSGGSALWTETQSVTVANGVYSVNLGQVTPIPLAFDLQYYLGVAVGADPEMTPRRVLTSVGYAYRAAAADQATTSAFATSANTANTATSAVTASSATTAQNFTGTLAGDVTGTQNATTVARIQNRGISPTIPAANQVLRYDGSSWNPSAVSLQTDVNGVLPVVSGGTGSSTKNFIDLSTTQTVGGAKTFSSPIASSVATGTAPFQVNSTTMVSNLNAEMVGGQRISDLDMVYQKKYWKVAVVEPYGHGDYTNPATAMADSSNWCWTATETGPCLLKIMPGFYDMLTPLQMQPYIDIEGSGEKATRLSGTMDGWLSGVVQGASNSEIRFLTVENRGGGADGTALSNYFTSPKLTHITAVASGSTTNYAVCNYGSASVLTDVTATASGGENSVAVVNTISSSVTMVNVSATASDGTYNTAVSNSFSSPIMNNVRARASGGTAAVGMSFANGTSSTVSNITVMALNGTSYNYGLDYYHHFGTFTNLAVEASGGSKSYGIHHSGDTGSASALQFRNLAVQAANGTSSYGIYLENGANSTYRIDQSSISGSSEPIFSGAGALVYIGGSKIAGGSIVGPGTAFCAGVYRDDYVFYPSSCP